MENQILLELRRIQNLMNYDRSTGTLISEDAQGAEIRQRAIDKEIIGQNAVGGVDPAEMRYPSITLGPQSKQPYPIMFDYPDGLPVMGSLETGEPIVWKFKEGMTGKSFIPATKFNIQVGQVKAADGTIKENQEYFEKNGVKYCLPVKEFWDLHTKNGWVYKFQNPRNGKTFNIKLELLGEGECNNSGDGKSYSGLECSQRCMGSNNGFVFNLNGFYLTGTGDPYNPKLPEHYDLRSQDDIFWDKWGIYIEIIVGLAVAFAAPYLAGALVGIFVEFGLFGARFGSLVSALSTATYAGGEATWLVIFTEILSEGALLSPMIVNYWSRGDDGNAMLAMAMCLVPFLTELKSVKGFISKGVGTKSLSDSVISKIELNGGFSVLFTKDEVAMREFVDVILNTQEKELFYTGVDLIKANDGKVLQEAFGEYLAKNGPTIEAGLAKSTNPEVKSAYQKFLKGVNNQLNPVTGKGLIPAFVRGTIVIGPVVIGFKYGYDKLKEIGFTDEQIDKTQSKINELMAGGSPYAKALLDLNESCGLGPEIPQAVVDTTIDAAIKDPNFKKDDEAQAKILEEETKKKTVEGFNQNIQKLADSAIKVDLNATEDLKNCDMIKIYGSLDLLDAMIVKLGYELPDWDNDQPTSYTNWTFVTGTSKGNVKFIGGDSGTFEIYIGDKKVHPV